MNKSLEALDILYTRLENANQVVVVRECSLVYLTIKQDLERLEEIDKAQEVEFNNLKFTENENKYQTSIRVLKEAFIALGKSDIANTCWFKYLEELENENQELKEELEIEKFDWFIVLNNKLDRYKKAIEILKEYYKFQLFPPAMDNIPEISISTDWEHCISQQEYELLKEVLNDDK